VRYFNRECTSEATDKIGIRHIYWSYRNATSLSAISPFSCYGNGWGLLKSDKANFTNQDVIRCFAPRHHAILRASPSIFLLDVLLNVPPQLDQTTPNSLKERNYLVDLGIARELELRVAALSV
jgi:hypothetical protein